MKVPLSRLPPLLPLVLTAALPLAATAQTAPAPPDTATTYKHQLGLTASPVLDGFFKNNRSLPLGLLYKRQTRPNQALRVRVVGQYSRRDTTDFLGTLDGSGIRQWAASGFVGYEWQRALSRKFNWYYGAEVGVGVKNLTRIDVREVPASGIRSSYTYDARNKVKTWQAQIRPFLGLNYNITSRINLFLENSITADYESRRYNYNLVILRQNSIDNLVENYASYTGETFKIRFYPIQFIGISIKI